MNLKQSGLRPYTKIKHMHKRRFSKSLFFFSAIAGISILSGCKPFQSLEYKGLSDWKVQPKSFSESKLAVKVHLFNPNKHAVIVKRLEASIVVNGKTWSSYNLDSSFVVPANAAGFFPLELTVKNSHLVAGLAGLASGNDLGYQFKGKIKGTYRKITAEVPFLYSGSFSEKDIRL